MRGHFQRPRIFGLWLGGAFRRGAPMPCPRRPAPPNSTRNTARSSCAPSALCLRGFHSSLANARKCRLTGGRGAPPLPPPPSFARSGSLSLACAPSLPLPLGRASAPPTAVLRPAAGAPPEPLPPHLPPRGRASAPPNFL